MEGIDQQLLNLKLGDGTLPGDNALFNILSQAAEKNEKPVEKVEEKPEEKKEESKVEVAYDLESVAKRITPKYENNVLGFMSLVEIMEGATDVSKPEYIEYTIKHRKERREFLKAEDNDKYEAMVLDYNEEVEKILEKGGDLLIEKLNITKQTFEESVIQLMSMGYFQEIYMLQAAVRQKIKECMPCTNPGVTLAQVKEIIKYQVEVLTDKPEMFEKVITKLAENPENLSMVPLIINTFLQDLTYLKFEIEEEDQMKNLSEAELFQDQEIVELMKKTGMAMEKIMSKIPMPNMPNMEGMEGMPMVPGMENMMPKNEEAQKE